MIHIDKATPSFSHRNQEPENSVLYLVSTPIGNLDDISYRAIRILKNVSLIACENTRQTRKILNKFEISNKLTSFNKHNSFKKIPEIINFLKAGLSIALVSDAGMPSICDPGEDLVSKAKENLIDTICIPGPCAALAALISSGMPSSKFIFQGFLPRKKNERAKILEEISKDEKTTILYESPHRLKTLLQELKEFCGEDRDIQVFRELTKKFEEHIGRNIKEVLKHFENKEVHGEITIVIKGLNKQVNQNIDKKSLKKEIYELVNAGLSLSAASKYLAKKTGIKKNFIYQLY